MSVSLITLTRIVPAIFFAGIIALVVFTRINAHSIWLASFIILGMPHGAYDTCRILSDSATLAAVVLKIIIYLSLALLAYLTWHFQPIWALIGFLSLTAYHWGMADAYWINPSMDSIRFMSALARGIWVVLIPLGFDVEGSSLIFEGMVGASSDLISTWMIKCRDSFLVVGFSALVLELFLLLKKNHYLAFVETLFIVLAATAIPAVLFLAAYFIGVHCWRYLLERSLETKGFFRNPQNLIIPLCVSLAIIPLWIVVYQVPLPIPSAPETTSKYLLIVSCFTLPHAILIQLQDGMAQRGKRNMPTTNWLCEKRGSEWRK